MARCRITPVYTSTMATRCWHCHHIKEGIIRYRIVVCSQLPSGTTSKKRISSWCLSPYWCWPRELALFAWCWSPFVSRCETTEFFLAFWFSMFSPTQSISLTAEWGCLILSLSSALGLFLPFAVFVVDISPLAPSTMVFLGDLAALARWHRDGQGPRVHHKLPMLRIYIIYDILWYIIDIMIYYDIVICK